MITNSEDLKKIQTALEELQKNLGIQDDEDFNENESYDFSYLKETYGFDMDELEKNLMSPKTTLDVKIQKINEDAVFPTYNYQTDSGFDFYSVEEVTIGPFGRALIPTGLRFDLPSNIELQVRSKSGLAIKEGLMVLNSPGTVDNGYTGEVQVIVFNTNQEPYTIKKGMKVAQGVFSYVLNGNSVELLGVDNIDEKDRNANGFGSTGL
jgi:dUTP pyrophosphatase